MPLEPRVTIIVTLYNLRREIADSLSSVVALDGDVPFDVLILDDASTDGSFEAAADFLDRHPRLPGATAQPTTSTEDSLGRATRYSSVPAAARTRARCRPTGSIPRLLHE